MTLPVYPDPHDYHPDLKRRRLRTLATILARSFDRSHSGLRRGQGSYTAAFSRIEMTRFDTELLQEKSDWVEVVSEYGRLAYCVFVGDRRERKPVPLRFSLFDKDVPEMFHEEAEALRALQLEIDGPRKPVQLDLTDYRPANMPVEHGLLRLRLEIEHNKAPELQDRRHVRVALKVLNEAAVELYSWRIIEAKNAPAASSTVIPAAKTFRPEADHLDGPQFAIKIEKKHEDSSD